MGMNDLPACLSGCFIYIDTHSAGKLPNGGMIALVDDADKHEFSG